MLQDKPVPISKKGLEKLQAELDELTSTKRREVADRIRTAKEFGDISENSEYEDAKNDQGWIEGRILTLEKMIRNAEIIKEPSKKTAGSVQLGSKVKVKDVKERVLPALDDEFAKDVGSFDTLVGLRADVHTRLEKMLKDRARALMAWRTATYAYPQQRLGQLLSNALHGTPWERDPFYVPDAELAQYLEAYAARAT